MDYTTLGRTGLKTSVAGLGAGGYSRLGQSYGQGLKEGVAVVKAALELGVNFFDTAQAYGTEEVLGAALEGRREDVILCTKTHVAANPFGPGDIRYLTPDEIRQRLEGSLENLRTDYVDIYHMHGIILEEYDHCVETVLPVLDKMRAEGKIRFLGITERFLSDTDHKMLRRAVQDDCWDVMMVGFNLLNPSARKTILPAARDKGIGILDMFAVRRALTTHATLKAYLESAVAEGHLDPEVIRNGDALAFLTQETDAETLAEAAYRFCRHEPGIDVVLTGTGRVAHLRENVAAINRPALPQPVLDKLAVLFGDNASLTGH